MKLSVRDHLFAHLFDKSLPDPAAKEAAAAERTQDFWEVDAPKGVYIRHRCQPRKGYNVPDEEIINKCDLSNVRFTDFVQSSLEDDAASEWDTFRGDARGYVQGKESLNVGRGSIPIHQVMQRCQNCTCHHQRDRQELTPQRRKLELKASGTWTSCSTKPVNVMTYGRRKFRSQTSDNMDR